MKYVKRRWFEEEGAAVCARCDLCDGELRCGEILPGQRGERVQAVFGGFRGADIGGV